MGEVFGRDPNSSEIPSYLAQLPVAARTHPVELFEHLLQSARGGAAQAEPRDGTEYLMFTCADIRCAVPLKSLREVRPSLPPVVSLPFSPDWLIGIFPLRTQLLALVDPGPILLGRSAENISSLAPRRRPDYSRGALSRRLVSAPLRSAAFPTTALLIGDGESVLAWAVTSVGDITLIPDEQIISASAMPLPAPEHYVTGIYAPAAAEERSIILNVDQVMADLLAQLTEKERSDE